MSRRSPTASAIPLLIFAAGCLPADNAGPPRVGEPAREYAATTLAGDEVELDLLIEWLLRILWTYLNAPSLVATGEDDMRRLLRMMLIPAVLKGSG